MAKRGPTPINQVILFLNKLDKTRAVLRELFIGNEEVTMRKLNIALVSILAFILLVVLSPASAQEKQQSEREKMFQDYLRFASLVKGGSVQPHWMADGNSFWYAEGVPEATVIFKVDPIAN